MRLKPREQTDLKNKNDIERNWYLVDAKDQVLGRLSSTIASYLIGKHKKDYVPHLDMGDNVIVINGSYLKLIGKKIKQKQYTYFSGYPAGLKKISLKMMFERKIEEVLRRAVLGMLPKNKLRQQRIKRLFIFKGEDHPFQDKPLIILNLKNGKKN